ncbi:cytochrome P450 [Escherichia coli]|uniref:cytochrome P450 n=1 Tax=Escherichia coli TaxID=562 RepID=UPI0021CAD0B3|nr:cytochrome P450 [Escherichia coli]
MSELSLSLTEAYKQRYDDIVRGDNERTGIYYHSDKKYWIIYDYQSCSQLLNSQYVTKKRMFIPLSIFDGEKTVIERFLSLINQSLIFRDESNSDVVRVIHHNFKNIPHAELIGRSLSLFNQKKCLNECDLITLNNTLAARLVGLEPSDTLAVHAHNVGMLFDGRVQGKDHFIEIAHSFLTVFDSCRNIVTSNIPCNDIQVSDRAIAYIAAHQTTMQLIVATLWAISHFNLKVGAENAREVVSEASRLYSPVLSVGRVMSQDLSFRGQSLKKGDRVMFYTGLANFDPAVFNEPFRFIPGRKEKPLSFGTGMHMCIGMGIALNFASSFIADICVRGLVRNVNITSLAEGVSAMGASSFSMGMNGYELDES